MIVEGTEVKISFTIREAQALSAILACTSAPAAKLNEERFAMSNKKLLKWAAKHVTEWPTGWDYLNCVPEGSDDGWTQTVYFSRSGPTRAVRHVECDKRFKTLQKVTRKEWEAARLAREARRTQPTRGATATLELGFKLEALVRYVATLHELTAWRGDAASVQHAAWLELPEGLRNRITQVTEDLRNAK